MKWLYNDDIRVIYGNGIKGPHLGVPPRVPGCMVCSAPWGAQIDNEDAVYDLLKELSKSLGKVPRQFRV